MTLNDLIAELIGNFNEEDGLIFNEDGSCLVNGFTKIEKINKSFKTSIDEKYQTLNGLVYAMLDGGKKEFSPQDETSCKPVDIFRFPAGCGF